MTEHNMDSQQLIVKLSHIADSDQLVKEAWGWEDAKKTLNAVPQWIVDKYNEAGAEYNKWGNRADTMNTNLNTLRGDIQNTKAEMKNAMNPMNMLKNFWGSIPQEWKHSLLGGLLGGGSAYLLGGGGRGALLGAMAGAGLPYAYHRYQDYRNSVPFQQRLPGMQQNRQPMGPALQPDQSAPVPLNQRQAIPGPQRPQYGPAPAAPQPPKPLMAPRRPQGYWGNDYA